MITQLPAKSTYVPLRIRQARVSRGMTQEELAKAVDVTKQAISQYETGTSNPGELVMSNIADVLKYPIPFFTKPPIAVSTAQTASFFRSYKTASAKDKAAWTQKVKIFEEMVVENLRKYVDFPKLNLPLIDYQENYSMDDCERIALYVRDYWGLGVGPIQNLIDVIQENGVIIANMTKKGKKIDAFSTVYNGTPYIYISEDTTSSVRWRFSLAHELGHLILHSALFDEGNIPEKIHDSLEQEANFFASAFLLPQETFFQDVAVISLDHFLYLKKKWKTSISSMILKCRNFDVISPSQTEALYKKMAIRKWRVSEPLDDICINEKPYVLKQAFKLLIENGITSANGIETDFGLHLKELAEWSFVPENVFLPKQAQHTSISLRPQIVR